MNHKELRRKDRAAMPDEETRELLRSTEYGVLSILDDEGVYGLPIYFAMEGDSLYFHSEPVGRKIDALAGNPRISFCVVGESEVLQEKFSTRYRSVIAFGMATLIDGEEKRKGSGSFVFHCTEISFPLSKIILYTSKNSR